MTAPQQDSGNTTATASVKFEGASAWLLCLFVTAALLLGLGVAIWALEKAGDAANQAQRAWDRAALAERESRLAQEDLIMLRAAVRQHGIPADGAGDH